MIKKVIKNILNKLPYISRLSKQVQELGSFPAGHYYSPIPSKAQVTKGVAQNSNGHLYLNIELNQADQLLLIEEFATYYKDLPFKNKRDQTAKGF